MPGRGFEFKVDLKKFKKIMGDVKKVYERAGIIGLAKEGEISTGQIKKRMLGNKRLDNFRDNNNPEWLWPTAMKMALEEGLTGKRLRKRAAFIAQHDLKVEDPPGEQALWIRTGLGRKAQDWRMITVLNGHEIGRVVYHNNMEYMPQHEDKFPFMRPIVIERLDNGRTLRNLKVALNKEIKKAQNG